MLGKDARPRNRQSDVRQFLQQLCPSLDKVRNRFFRQCLWGILMSRCMVVARWLRWIALAGERDRCHRAFYRHKRLLHQLESRHWSHRQVIEQYQRNWARRIDPDTPLIIDLCDLARPRARKLKYLALVRDGSNDGKLVNGYWCLEIYAYLGGGRITPLLLHPYSIDDPEVLGENVMFTHTLLHVARRIGFVLAPPRRQLPP